ncbi:ROK family protein [Roseibium sp.]|uniref:ROK family protein n=1 Tax=Roseibium sp. TaxID=1936156 RepID=UPI003D1418D8
MKFEKREQQILAAQKGSNQVAVRGFNERLVLDLVRKNGALTKAEATRLTGLSPNAVSVIFRALENENLLLRGAPIKGRIGQPSVPMRINPDARYYLGLKIGRHVADFVVIDFTGQVRSVVSTTYKYPMPDETVAFARNNLPSLLKGAGLEKEQISGFGIAMPDELWNWTMDFGAPKSKMEIWRDVDLSRELSDLGPWPVYRENDGTAACGAELLFGPHQSTQDLLYFFVGTLIGGGIALNGSVFRGRTGRAAGFGPMRVPVSTPGKDRLVDYASLSVLENMIERAGGDRFSIYGDENAWQENTGLVEKWLETTALGIAHAIVSSLSVIDFETVVIDGSFPPTVREKLVELVSRQLDQLDLQGIEKPAVEGGRWGPLARAVGAAALPLADEYVINQNTLMRH